MAVVDGVMRRDAPWWDAAAALTIASSALGVTLLVPKLFSDPNGLDPYVLRLAAVGAVLGMASLLSPRLAPMRSVLLSVAAITVSYSLFAGAPRLLTAALGRALSGPAQLFWASLAQVLVTLGFVWAAWRTVPADLRPTLRLGHFSPLAATVAVFGMVAFVPIGLAIPASLLGREGIAVVAIVRDVVWLAPACLLQAFAQEVQFRGLLLGSLERVAPPGQANLAQATLFGLAHLAIQYPGPIGPFVPVTVVFGLIFGMLVQRTRSIWPAVLIHGVADVAITITVIPGLYGL